MKARRPLLLPLVPLYAAALRGERMLVAEPRRLARPVVSVGSLSAGGAGKTPVVAALAGLLARHGYAVDVLSRGYGRASQEVQRVDPRGRVADFGDEPLLLARETEVPVYVGADRYAAGLLAEKELPGDARTIHLLDDGFQHRRLGRNLDVAPGHTLIKWFGYGLSILAALLLVFTIGRRNDALNIVLLAIPVVIFILLLLAPQAFGMTARGGRIRTLNVLTALPILVMLGMTFGAGVLDVRYAFAPAALCGAITLLLGLALASRRLPGSLIAGLVFFGLYGAAYGYAAMIFADTRLDHAEPQTFQTQVLGHAAHTGRSTRYDLTLAPWGSLTQPDTVQVPHAVYGAIEPGQTACVTLHSGLLRMPWRTAAPCPAA